VGECEVRVTVMDQVSIVAQDRRGFGIPHGDIHRRRARLHCFPRRAGDNASASNNGALPLVAMVLICQRWIVRDVVVALEG
jgi:hypothetical protein